MSEKKNVNRSWHLTTHQFNPQRRRFEESLFSQANEYMGIRACFEEAYSGDSHKGCYLNAVYYPDPTKVGWWKNGLPKSYAKLVNIPNWLEIGIEINHQAVDLFTSTVENYKQDLDMKNALLKRAYIWKSFRNESYKIEFSRFISQYDKHLAIIQCKISNLNLKAAEIKLSPAIDTSVFNQDANYDRQFIDLIDTRTIEGLHLVRSKVRKSGFHIIEGFSTSLSLNNQPINGHTKSQFTNKKLINNITINLEASGQICLTKYVSIFSSIDYPDDHLTKLIVEHNKRAIRIGHQHNLELHTHEWKKLWDLYDIKISGDENAQNALRFNNFQLLQTFSGRDSKLNISPKGFSGEKYGGATYWDTEAFCLPYYLIRQAKIAEALLKLRYDHLDNARKNAKAIGLKGALFPMVTVDGIECHNEWEITFEEIHRNNAIAYAIYQYTKYTGDPTFLYNYGLEILIEIARFWASRVNFSDVKKQYVILGVTGPNEYENNVNNNWYTNFTTKWMLSYTLESLGILKKNDQKTYLELLRKSQLNTDELKLWETIESSLYLPYFKHIPLQQDGFLDKTISTKNELTDTDLPLCQKWSWDRILRSPFIKQADVLQGVYLFTEKFNPSLQAEIFHFYEPLTVHESSLSPAIHSIVAARMGDIEKSYELFLRSCYLDLKNLNSDTHEGCHITSMATGSLAIIQGFCGLNFNSDRLSIDPKIPKHWREYSFKVNHHDQLIEIKVTPSFIELKSPKASQIEISGKIFRFKKALTVRKEDLVYA